MSKEANPIETSLALRLSEGKTPVTQYDSNKRTIVVAEDSAVTRKVLIRTLQGAFNVYPAADGEEALALTKALTARDQKPAAIISDFDMGGANKDGNALLANLRSWEASSGQSQTNFIFQTGGNDEKKNDFAAQGALFTIKPFSLAKLKDAIATEQSEPNPNITQSNKIILAAIATLITPMPKRSVSAPAAGAGSSAASASPPPPRALTIPESHEHQSAESQPPSPKIISPKPQHVVQQSALLSATLPSPPPEIGGRNNISPTLAQMARDLAPAVPPSPEVTPPLPDTPRATSAPAAPQPQSHVQRLTERSNASSPPSPGNGRSS